MKRLQFILKMQDRVTATARRVQRSVEGISERVTLARKKLQGFGKSARDIGGQLSTRITAPVIALGGWFIKLASDANEMRSQFHIVFGSMADETANNLKRIAEQVGRSDTTLMGFATSFGAIFNAMGFADDQSAKMSTALAQLSVDLSSFFNISESDAMAKLQSGLAGETEALRSLGIFMNQATLEQELFNMGVTGGIESATEQQKVLARLAIIMRGTTQAQGDAARTSDQFANTLRTTLEDVKDLGRSIGAKLLPYAKQLLLWVQDAITWFQGLSEKNQKLILIIVGLSAALGPLLVVLGATATAVAAIVSPVGLVIVGIAALVAVVVWAYNKFDWFRNGVNAIWNAFQRDIQRAGKSWQQFKTVVGTVADWLVNHTRTAIDLMTAPIRILMKLLTGDFAGAFGILRDTASSAFGGLFGVIDSVTQALITKVADLGGQLMHGLANGITNALGSVKDSITGAADSVVGWFKDKLGIHSPSKVFEGLGKTLPAGLERGILSGQRQVARAVTTLGAAAIMSAPGASAATVPAPQAASLARGGNTYQITVNVPVSGGGAQETADAVEAALTELLERLASEEGA